MDHIVPGESKDKALDLLRRHNIEFDPDSDEAKRVLRKIDWRIMPMIFTIYLLQLMVCGSSTSTTRQYVI